MSQSRLIELNYYDPKAEVRLSAYADTLALNKGPRENTMTAIRFGGYPQMVNAMVTGWYGNKKVFHFNDDVEGYKAFKGWVEAHKARTGAETVIIGFEPTGHYWFSFGRYVKRMGMMLVLVNS